MEEKRIEVREPELIAPATPEKVLQAMERFKEFKAKVLDKDDYVEIQGKPFVKKSGWLKYALACNITLQKVEERVEKFDNRIVYSFTYRAIAPNGRYVDAVGSASSNERSFAHLDHDPRALASTRAMNRAISNLIAGGEVSAEEVAGTQPTPDELQYMLKDEIEQGYLTIEQSGSETHIVIQKDIPAEAFKEVSQLLHDYGATYKRENGKRYWKL